MTRLALAAAIAASMLCSCASSPPMKYYTLSAITPAARLQTAADAVPLRIDRVTIPTELDRTQLVRRLDANRLQILENDRWAAPLDDMVQRVLSDNLAARLPRALVANPNEPALGERRRSLSVDIQEFYGDRSCAVVLRAAWTLKEPDSQGTRSNEETRIASSPNCTDPEALPAAMSQALAQLSDRIAADVANVPAAAHP
jgi:uncharacterized lipoprotein YmbA